MFKRAIRSVQDFINLESSGGIVLFIMAVIAILIDNSRLSTYYEDLTTTNFAIQLGPFALSKPLIKWVNDGLMTIFFFLVGLEIKREVLEGELNSHTKIALPGIAAIGGMLIPALIYLGLNYHNPIHIRGWAIPTATDIAFALGLLALLGNRVPVSLKVFLTALAILDDLGAIIIIAIFYTVKLSLLALGLGMVCFAVLLVFNLANITAKIPYIFIGFLLWVCIIKSGIHGTLAGVALAMTIPTRDKANPSRSPLREFEHGLHPWVAFLVLPIFAFFNAGVSFVGFHPSVFLDTVPLGIAMGLFVGKQVGVFGTAWLAVKLKIANLPDRVTWLQMYGLALICGIGFTMSLFIGVLAFNEADAYYATAVRMGVLLGSIVAGILGYVILYFAPSKKGPSEFIERRTGIDRRQRDRS
ncbi:MAG: Na+/H+ antiporter NhaA [Pseudomonadota bacterium]